MQMQSQPPASLNELRTKGKLAPASRAGVGDFHLYAWAVFSSLSIPVRATLPRTSRIRQGTTTSVVYGITVGMPKTTPSPHIVSVLHLTRDPSAPIKFTFEIFSRLLARREERWHTCRWCRSTSVRHFEHDNINAQRKLYLVSQ